jgi:uncharacterized protein
VTGESVESRGRVCQHVDGPEAACCALRAGRFLLTGSARLLGLRDLPDALPGRTETTELWPLSQGEIDSAVDGFVDIVFRLDGNLMMPPCPLTKRDYVARALRGGYPEAVRRGPGLA